MIAARGYAALLTPLAQSALSRDYRYFRERQASEPAACLYVACLVLARSLLRLESPAWQQILGPERAAFDHLNRRALRPGDPLRYAIQALWLLCVRPAAWARLSRRLARFAAMLDGGLRRGQSWLAARYAGFMDSHAVRQATPWQDASARAAGHRLTVARRAAMVAGLALSAPLAAWCITQPLNWNSLFIFVLALWCLALVIRRLPGRMPALMLIALSVIVSCRYLWWRYTSTLHWDDPLDAGFGIALVVAETHSWLVLMLGYIQTAWPLRREPTPLPADTGSWPSVDLFIPTYNEDLSVVAPTVHAALNMDWPKGKLKVYILDDGKREAFREFAAACGAGYLTRPDNRHAKAGNLNHALARTDGELLALFDCDHVPARSFLQLTVGGFLKDRRLALVQTPHHFFSPDPFERNLGIFRSLPNENILFYGLIQDGNDTWDATFFCGSCAVLRRSAVEEIGGFAVETVTEDAHTALRLHRAGYASAYLRIPQAAGLATESLAAHIGQRMRWARGMVQIFRRDNPMLGKGLSLAQRLCYLNSTLHFLAGVPRLVYLLAPLAFLLLHAYIIYAPAIAIALYVLPHMALAAITNSRLQGRYRHSFWSEVYETVLAWYIAWPTTAALIMPSKGRFNVTAKGGQIEKTYFDWKMASPYLLLAALNCAGLGFGFWRLATGPADETFTVLITMAWVLYNLTIIGVAIAVATEAGQARRRSRVATELPCNLALRDGSSYPAVLLDYADDGAGLRLPRPGLVRQDDAVMLTLLHGGGEYLFPAMVQRAQGDAVDLALAPMDAGRHRDYMRCTFGRAHAWLDWTDGFPEDRPLRSFFGLVSMCGRGYAQLARHAPEPAQRVLRLTRTTAYWAASFAPRPIPSHAAWVEVTQP